MGISKDFWATVEGFTPTLYWLDAVLPTFH